jgi:hypothetical protein
MKLFRKRLLRKLVIQVELLQRGEYLRGFVRVNATDGDSCVDQYVVALYGFRHAGEAYLPAHSGEFHERGRERRLDFEKLNDLTWNR